ncbi:hypothetical protein X474_23840 [Dethiosulfatarculus sandiegensis]|uniref:Uncharacterized protein n=1 Tax=Dethiosulfatarculus sandiegensis TaxID=1429043 RepID=A0A0D2G9M2_9BACT|nr:hypothetical protein X474_23840 [Dethiosulfatarculus sandiegensis]
MNQIRFTWPPEKPAKMSYGSPRPESISVALLNLLRPLPQEFKKSFLGLWEEYEFAATPEARILK